MRFECGNCGAKYKISDAKVAGRVVRFPCRKCDNKILIDGRVDDITVPAGQAYGFDDITRRSEPASPFGAEPATARRRPVPSARRRSSSIPPRRAAASARRMSSSPAAAASAFVGQQPALTPPLPVGGSAGQLANPGHDKPEWHVSINDVPVGPIRLEEMAHKVDAGAVSEYSLVWRDGFEEWRPLATVPELMSLLYQRRSSGPPTRSKFSSMPPFVEAQTAIKETPDDRHPPSVPPGPPKPPVHMLGGSAPMNSASGLSAGAMGASGSGAFSVTASAPVPAPSGFSAAPNDFEPLADSLQPDISLPSIPAMLSDLEPDVTHYPVEPVPAPVVESTSASFAEVSSPTEQPVSIPVVAPQPITQEPRGTSAVWVWVWVLLLGVVVFSAVAAFMVVDRFGDTLIERFLAEESVSAPARVNVAPPAAVAEPVEETVVEDATAPEGGESIASGEGDPEQAAGAPVADEELQENAVDATEEAPDPEPVDAAPEETKTAKAPVAKKKAVARSRRRAKPKRPAKPAPAASSTGIKKLGDDSNGLSASEQKLLAQFGSGKSAGVAKIDVKEQGSTSSQRDALDSKAVSSTVTSNKPRLQRCYERAIRGQQSPTAVRMNVSINVAASGRVSSVEVAGNGPGGLKECMEASIRRWKFPASSAGGPAKFPIVFSAN